MEQNFTYLVRCADGSLYCGWTNDLEKRVRAHNEGRGAKYTKSRRPVSLVYYEIFETKQEAMKREWQIKQLSRKEKLSLIQKDSFSLIMTGHHGDEGHDERKQVYSQIHSRISQLEKST